MRLCSAGGPTIALLALVCAISAQDSKQQRPITEVERTFLGAALSYLQTANDQGTEVAQKMAGASNGSATLGDIRAALSSAKRIERAGYEGDYRSRIKGSVPSSFAVSPPLRVEGYCHVT